MTTIAINLNCVAGALARGATVLGIGLRGTRTSRVLAFIFLVVCHVSLLKSELSFREDKE